MNNLIILGSGPAGLTAGIYASRADLKPLIVSGPQPGGQLTITTEVDNFPGFAEGVMGPELMSDMRKQAERFGCEFKEGLVESVDFSGDVKKMVLENGDVLEAKVVIVATGASAMWLNIPGETELRGKGVSACATCDGFFFRDRKVVVVGGGDSALEEATYLTKFASEVVLLVRKDSFKASKSMQKRALDNEKITVVWNSEAQEVLGDESVTGVRVLNNVTNEESVIETDGFFVAIGHRPNTSVFEGAVDMDSHGYVVLGDCGNTKTSVDGVFAAGDVSDTVYKQAITAAGSGCKAALDAQMFLGE